jgi:hypothetical protein
VYLHFWILWRHDAHGKNMYHKVTVMSIPDILTRKSSEDPLPYCKTEAELESSNQSRLLISTQEAQRLISAFIFNITCCVVFKWNWLIMPIIGIHWIGKCTSWVNGDMLVCCSLDSQGSLMCCRCRMVHVYAVTPCGVCLIWICNGQNTPPQLISYRAVFCNRCANSSS